MHARNRERACNLINARQTSVKVKEDSIQPAAAAATDVCREDFSLSLVKSVS